LGATVVALVWANSAWSASYGSFWHRSIEVTTGGWALRTSVVHLVNDGLMALFFFVIGLELRGEWVSGELQDRRAALLPALAALGGMVVPALLYLVVAGGTAGAHGWGIPMATDIAFAVGLMALLGARVPGSLKVFLLTLAIVDDLGAIVVIAVFYAGDLRFGWLAAAVVGLAIVYGMQRGGVRNTSVYWLVGALIWFATWQSGVHATIAGVALGLLAPSGPRERLAKALHPWTSFVVVPVFALANAGVALGHELNGPGLRVSLGVVVGLVVGKLVGVAGATWLTVRLGLAPRPAGATWPQVGGVAALAGIGFTMSLFVTDLAFTGRAQADDLVAHAKLGVLGASVIAATVGSALLVVAGWDRSGGRQPV
jgi:NhaA family Na+:H+ antiporter